MKYRCDSVESRMDGSGEIAWDVWALDDSDNIIPGKHVTVLTPWEETQTALAGGALALKALLVKYAPSGWDNDALSEVVAANLNSESVVSGIDDFIEGVGGYPVEFSL